MDRQSIFDTVHAHLLRQMSRSIMIEPGALPQHRNGAPSAYRGSFRNMKCAIGACIPDSVYHPNMEGTPIRKLISSWPRIEKLFKPDSEADIEFLEALQNVHDMIQPPFWDEYLAMTANKFHVVHPNPEIMRKEDTREHKKRRQ